MSRVSKTVKYARQTLCCRYYYHFVSDAIFSPVTLHQRDAFVGIPWACNGASYKIVNHMPMFESSIGVELVIEVEFPSTVEFLVDILMRRLDGTGISTWQIQFGTCQKLACARNGI